MKSWNIKFSNADDVIGTLDFGFDACPDEESARKAFSKIEGANTCKILSVSLVDSNPENIDDETMDKMVARLEEMSNLEGTEVGEVWDTLVRLWASCDYVSPQFQAAIRAEIVRSVQEIDTKYHVVEEEEEMPITRRKVRRLEFIG